MARRRRATALKWSERRDNLYENRTSQRLQHFREDVRQQYGFLANPSWPLWRNMRELVKNMPVREFLEQPRNTAVHNLLFEKPLPAGTKTLFGKGLRFCLRSRTPANKLDDTIDRYNNDMRRTNFWIQNPQPEGCENVYNPKLYFRSATVFNPNSPELEEILEDFASSLRKAERRWRSRNHPNLTPRQYQLLLYFRESDEYIIIEADKNLGVCILEREYYIRRAIEEHLGDREVYKRISIAEANTIQYKLSFRLSQWLGKHSKTVPEHERDFLRTGRNRCGSKLAWFRMSCKLHKTPNWHLTKGDLKFRPIVACCGTWLNCWSKWLDYYLSKRTPFIPTY